MTVDLVVTAADRTSVRIGRQAIFDVDRRVVAHELLFRGTSRLAADLAAADLGADGDPGTNRLVDLDDQATSRVIAATFGDFGVQMLGAGKPLFINLTRPFLTGQYSMPFGPDGVVLEVLEHVAVDQTLLDGLARLRSQGFTLAADAFVGEPHRWSLLALVDVVKVDLMGLRTPLDALLTAVREANPHVTLLAERVEDDKDLPLLHEAGFTMFQGYAFARPAVLETTRMSPSQLVCLRLMRALADPTSSAADIERVVAADPGLSLRILRTANSAGTGAVSHISSLRQAVVLLGPVALSAWVTLTLMGALGSGRREDLVLVLTRAGACAGLATERTGLDPSVAYTAGMLAAIASVMGADPVRVAEGAGMDPAMTSAIAEGIGPIGALVRAVDCYEREDDAALADTGVAPFDVSRAYLQALSTALSLVEGVLGSEL
jgi:EAL and modified HD-GYP domain-containing signal transduction protein